MQIHGKNVEETGKVILETIESYVASYPKLLLQLLYKP